jgi:hypothetical protein
MLSSPSQKEGSSSPSSWGTGLSVSCDPNLKTLLGEDYVRKMDSLAEEASSSNIASLIFHYRQRHRQQPQNLRHRHLMARTDVAGGGGSDDTESAFVFQILRNTPPNSHGGGLLIIATHSVTDRELGFFERHFLRWETVKLLVLMCHKIVTTHKLGLSGSPHSRTCATS